MLVGIAATVDTISGTIGAIGFVLVCGAVIVGSGGAVAAGGTTTEETSTEQCSENTKA